VSCVCGQEFRAGPTPFVIHVCPPQGGNKNPAAPFRERRAHIFNVDICSKSQSTRQWALMGFFQFSAILPIL
jgi:hypothetical protein